MSRPNFQIAIIVGLVLLVALNLGLGQLPLMGADEPRYVRIGQEMVESGDYVTPTLNGRPWLEKPPLLFWMEAAVLQLFPFSEWSARLPIALLATLTVLSCGWLVGRMVGFQAGILAILVVATTPLFFIFARAASTDLPLSACLTLATLTAYRAFQTGAGIWALVSGLTLALAVLAKGPVAVLLLLGIVICFWTVTGSRLGTVSQWAVAGVTFTVVAAPWFLWVWEANGQRFVATFWLNHHLARFVTDVHHHSQPFWFYGPILLVGCAPWILFAGVNAWRHWSASIALSDESMQLEVYLWLWALVPLVFFSLCRSKLPGYVLPVAVPIGLLAALELDRMLSGDDLSDRAVRWLRPLLAIGAVLVGISTLSAMAIVYDALGMGVVLAAPWLAIACGMVWARNDARRLVPVLVVSMTLLAGLAFSVVAPSVGIFHSSKGLVEQIRPQLSVREPLVFYRFFHHSALYYTDYRALQESIDTVQELRVYMQSNPQEWYWVLTQENGLEDLQAAFDTRLTREGRQFLVEVKRPSDLGLK